MNSSCSILIVDDSEADRVTYRRYLKSDNNLVCHIFDCASAESALKFCDGNRPDIILLDYCLPDADGVELLQYMTAALGTLPPVIMLTGQGSETVAVEAMKHGVRDYIAKGQLTPQKLVNSVTQALNEQNLQAQVDRHSQQRELLTNVALDICRASELFQILQTAVEGARKLLGCDRTLIYCLQGERRGMIVAESVLPQWAAAMDSLVEDNCFHGEQAYQMEKYLQGYRLVIRDIDKATLTPCHRKMLETFQVKAVLAAPIILRDGDLVNKSSIWGLIVAHHCHTVCEWQPDELALLDELGTQMAIAIQQADLVSDLKEALAKQQNVQQQLRDQVAEIGSTNTRLAEVSRLVERRNQELDEFSHIVSHELQAPLRGVANLTEWLMTDLDGQLPAENQQQLTLIQNRVLRMSGLISGLLEYARVDKANTVSSVLSISHLLAEVVDMLMPPPAFQVKFSAHLPTIETPTLLLKQVLTNLIGNALKYHDKSQGKIEILVKPEASGWRFTVIDDGPGIAPEYHQKIFDIFQTQVGHNDRKGTGIGLAIVKKIVESQGGKVWVESAIGQGSAFSFTWPLTT